MDTPQEAFQYEALDHNTHSFRILRLLGGIDRSDIICELFHSSLENSPPYEALSYTWGNPELVEAITVNDKALRITDNLNTALHFLRRPDRPRLLWIDAACIDQDNYTERGHQVQKMRDIFSRAEKVFVWLGKATNEIEFLMDRLGKFEQQSQAHAEVKGNGLSEFLSQGNLAVAKKGLQSLLQRPWFRRVWVLQEVANARSASVCVGRKTIPATTLAKAPAALAVQPDSYESSVLDIMLNSCQSIDPTNAGERDLCSLMQEFSGCEASDERDKIYALLGMCADAQDTESILPDYSMDLLQIVKKTMRYLLEIKLVPVSTILGIFSLFQGVTAVFLAANFDDPLVTSRTVSPEILEKTFGSMSPSMRASFLIIEPRRLDDADDESCYNEASRLIIMQGPVMSRQSRYDSPLIGLPWSQSEHGSNVKILYFEEYRKALEKAMKYQCARIGESLIDSGIAFPQEDEEDDFLSRCLIAVSLGGNVQLAKLLIARGADANFVSYDGTALQAAAENGHGHVAEVLIAAGADVNCYHNDRTPLLLASCGTNPHVRVVKILIRHGANVNLRREDRDALQDAARWGNAALVRILIKAGADINAPAGRYGTALQAATTSDAYRVHGERSILKMLLRTGGKERGYARLEPKEQRADMSKPKRQEFDLPFVPSLSPWTEE